MIKRGCVLFFLATHTKDGTSVVAGCLPKGVEEVNLWERQYLEAVDGRTEIRREAFVYLDGTHAHQGTEFCSA